MYVTLKNYKPFIFRASVSFEILTVVTITNTVYRNVTPGTPVYTRKYRDFGGISCLHLQGACIIVHENNRWQIYKLINMM
jgi:hypothetical protein